MRVFQILDNEVLIINDKKEYKDSVANFKVDSGVTIELPVKSIYDDLQKLPVIQYKDKAEEWKDFPIQELETYIDSVQTYLDSKEKREYVGPTAEETQAANLAKLDADYGAQLDDLKDQIVVAATVAQDDAYADELRQQRQDLQTEYITKRGAL